MKSNTIQESQPILFSEKKGSLRKSKWSVALPYLMISPYFLIYGIFILIPLGAVFYLSFTNYSIMNPGEWVGLENYRQLFKDPVFMIALKNTSLYWFFSVVPSMIIGLIVAVFLNTKIKAAPLFRGLIYLPGVLSGVAVAMTWKWLYSPNDGPINMILQVFGLSAKDWLKDPSLALPAVIVVGIWMGVGFSMIIYMAGLQGIPEQLYEASSIDGANKLKQFFKITIPLLKPMTLFLFIMNTITSFQVFDIIYVMTGGGPANRTTTIVNEIVTSGFEEYKMGYASALTIFLLGIVLIFTVINFALNSKSEQ